MRALDNWNQESFGRQQEAVCHQCRNKNGQATGHPITQLTNQPINYQEGTVKLSEMCKLMLT